MTEATKVDWKKLAEARGCAAPTEAAVATLDALETAFRPLTARLKPEDDLSVVFQADVV